MIQRNSLSVDVYLYWKCFRLKETSLFALIFWLGSFGNLTPPTDHGFNERTLWPLVSMMFPRNKGQRNKKWPWTSCFSNVMELSRSFSRILQPSDGYKIWSLSQKEESVASGGQGREILDPKIKLEILTRWIRRDNHLGKIIQETSPRRHSIYQHQPQ